MNNDLISREALKKAIETYDKFAYLPNGKLCPCRDLVELEMYVPYIHFDDVIKAIDNAPTVKFSLMPADESKDEAYMRGYEKGKVEGILRNNAIPQGEWARHDEWRNGEYIGGFYHINCPEIEKGMALFSKWETNFCPNCGAQMKGGAE